MILNKELYVRTQEETIKIQIKRTKWNWIGYTLHNGSTIQKEALQESGKRGRAKLN